MRTFEEKPEGVDRNKIAMLLSVLPGAGHLYKHHYAAGCSILTGTILVSFVAFLLAIATLGISLVVIPLLWWGAVAASAYSIEDWHGKHHWMHPWR